jgi:hypothetical protein
MEPQTRSGHSSPVSISSDWNTDTVVQEPKPGPWPRLKNMILPSMILSFNPFHVQWINLNRHQIEFTTLVKGKTKSWVAKS